MSIFDLRQSVIDEYSKYVQSFHSIADERIRAFIEESILEIPMPSGLGFVLAASVKRGNGKR